MKMNEQNLFYKQSISCLSVVLLSILVFSLLVPQRARAQNIPPVPKPTLAGTWCPSPSCKKYIDCRGGKRPSACPHCGYSFVQQTRPHNSPTGPIPPLGRPGGLYHPRPPKPTDTKLYYDDDLKNGVKTPSNDPKETDEVLAKLKEQERKKKEEAEQNLEKNKNALLKGVEPQKLNNPFAGDPSVVDLSATKGPVVITPKQTQQAPNEHTFMQQLNDEARYAHMSSSDLRWLASQYPNNAEIQAQTKIMEKLADERDTLQFKHLAVRSLDDRANETLKKRDEAMDSMAENAADQVIPGFGGIALKTAMSEDSAAEKRKGLISFAAEKMIENSDIYTKSAEIFTEKIGESLTKKLLIVPTVYEFSRDAAKAGYYQHQYNEQHKILDPTGGPSKTMGDWERVNSQILDESAKLHTLITREKKATSDNP